MNKYITTIIVVILLTITAVGINNLYNPTTDTPERIKIQISGSTTTLPIIEECALAFMEINDADVFVAAGGSSAGIRAVHDDISDIGMSSRELKPEELPGTTVTPVAQDKIAIIVHPDNPMDKITMNELKRIYNGKTINFDYVGGEDTLIMVVTREAGSGTRSTFESIVMDKTEITNTAIVAASNGILRKTVAGNEAAIGYISAGYVDDTVKELNVDVDIARNLYLVTDENPDPEIQMFIDFILSDAGQDIVEGVGFEKV